MIKKLIIFFKDHSKMFNQVDHSIGHKILEPISKINITKACSVLSWLFEFAWNVFKLKNYDNEIIKSFTFAWAFCLQ